MDELTQQQDAYPEVASRLRDLEEKNRLLKDRLLLIGKSIIDGRENMFLEMQDMKKSLVILQEENARFKELIQRMVEQLNASARKEELMILQRQFDLFRKE